MNKFDTNFDQQLACRSEMESRAKELVEMIASPVLLPLAIKYASKLGRIHLAEKLGELSPVFDEVVRTPPIDIHMYRLN